MKERVLIFIAIVAGVISGGLFLLLNAYIEVSPRTIAFASASVGATTTFAVEGILRGEPFRDVLLRKMFPSIACFTIAYYLIWR
jgi:hypothetical protein